MAKMVVDKISSSSISEENHHPYAFHVSGPTNLPRPSWRDIFISSRWKTENHKRSVLACFVQAVYLLELDRQENRTPETALAPNWWKPFKYKLSQTLIDERDGSIFGAVLEWDGFAATKPSGAPRVVLALRGTLLKRPTILRDIIDDLRLLAWESLEGSVRFSRALDVLKSSVDLFGSCNVCFAGHSLGAGFGFQVGKALLVKQGVSVDTYLFNPPSVSLAMTLRKIIVKAGFVWKSFKWMFPFSGEAQTNDGPSRDPGIRGLKTWKNIMKWVPRVYVNNNDYVCCYYTDPEMKDNGASNSAGKENADSTRAKVAAAKIYVVSKGKQKISEAHGLEQWWKDDLELQLVLKNSKLIDRKLEFLYSLPVQAPPRWKAHNGFVFRLSPSTSQTGSEPA
ncbi:GDSL esterase/lipase At4g10955-like [Papaver somniferum]|uniref:GDSL esterase/lipase At4g10955-like n=1 Tax=Papaver somniferum TaxID=3469 RepID=UPI000E6F8094|nr:GDSL esterase/lipase At4g10955-like [Papaver somniferum]